MFKATLNTERSADDKVRLLDGIAQFEPMSEFNVWIGRMLPPSDRANLYGPYFAVPWSFPGVVSNYPNIAAGRDNGVTIWGKPLAGKLTYAVGAFDGHNKVAGLSGQKPAFPIGNTTSSGASIVPAIVPVTRQDCASPEPTPAK